MTIQQVNEDIDRLLALDTAVAPLAPQSLELDTLPQTLVMEIGRISLPLGDIKQIAEQARDYLVRGGLLAVEHGYDQGKLVRQMFTDFGYDQVKTMKDYGGNDRVTLGIYG